MRNRSEEPLLYATVPHFDVCPAGRAAPEKRRLWVQLLKVAANSDRLRDCRTVIEEQYRHALHRIDGREFRGLQVPRHEIDPLEGYFDPLLREKDTNTTGVRCLARLDDPHRMSITRR